MAMSSSWDRLVALVGLSDAPDALHERAMRELRGQTSADYYLTGDEVEVDTKYGLRSATIVRQEKQGTFTVQYSDGKRLRGVRPKRIFPRMAALQRNPRDPVEEEDVFYDDLEEYEREHEREFFARLRQKALVDAYAAGHGADEIDEDELRRDMKKARERAPRRPYRYRIVKQNPREIDLSKTDLSKLAYVDEEEGAFVTPVKNPAGAVGRCETFHGDGACGDAVEKKLWMPGPIVLMGDCLDCGYDVTNRRSNKDGRYVHDHKSGVKLYRRANGDERPSKTLSPPRQVFVLGNWLGCTYDDGTEKQELMGSSRIKACTDDGKRLFAIHSTKGCLYVVSGGSFRIRDWMYD